MTSWQYSTCLQLDTFPKMPDTFVSFMNYGIFTRIQFIIFFYGFEQICLHSRKLYYEVEEAIKIGIISSSLLATEVGRITVPLSPGAPESSVLLVFLYFSRCTC